MTLSPVTFANFYLYATLPAAMFKQKMQVLLSGQSLSFSGADAFWGDSHFNFSFSPRSALLLFSFGLSIQLRGNIRHQSVGRLCTFGFRPSLSYFLHLVSHFAVWNERYLDFFHGDPIAGSADFALSDARVAGNVAKRGGTFAPDQRRWVLHWNGLDRADSPWCRLVHLPVHRQLYQPITNSMVWDQVPRELWQSMARARL